MSGSEFSADKAESAAEAEAKLASAGAHYDAILLDVGLSDSDGQEFCAKLRRDGRRMPVVMVTGADAEQDVIRGLDAGANDYLAKPYRLPELLGSWPAMPAADPKWRLQVGCDRIRGCRPLMSRPCAA